MKLKLHLSTFLIALLGMFSFPASAQLPVAQIDKIATPTDLAPYINYLEDADHSITYEDIISGDYDSLWKTNGPEPFVANNINSRYWLMLQINNTRPLQDTPLVLEVRNMPTVIYKLGLWVNAKGKTTKHNVGQAHPYNAREIKRLRYGFTMPNEKGLYTLYILVDNSQTSYPALLPLYLKTKDDFYHSSEIGFGVATSFYSITISLLLYNLFLCWSLREKVYGIYSLLLCSFILNCAAVDGVASFWFWPDDPAFGQKFGVINGCMNGLLYVIFVKLALNGIEFSPKLATFFDSLFYIGVMGTIYVSIGNDIKTTGYYAQTFSSVIGLIVLVTVCLAIKHKVPSSGYVLVAEICAIFGAVIFMLTLHGTIPLKEVGLWGIHLGYLCEVQILALAIAQKTRLAQSGQLAAETMNEAKMQFFASMNHELRTPLTAILGYAESAEPLDVSPSEKQKAIETINRSGKHLLQIVNDILDLSKVEAQKLEVELIPVDTFQLMAEVEEYSWILAKNKGIEFTTNVEFPIPSTITTDPTRLKQILINLCGNAIKFTETGGVSINLHCNASEEKLYVDIIDTGIGLKPEQVDSLFDAFTQADSATTRQFGGTGLGLHLSKLLAQNLGGDITVTSTFGKGSTFTVSVSISSLFDAEWINSQPSLSHENSNQPIRLNNLDRQAEINEELLKKKKTEEKKRIRVLLAEDNLDNQSLIKLHLTRSGCDTICVTDGADALAQALTEEFDLILMDMQMPNMDGMTAVKTLRSKGYDKPIYALTANETSNAIQRCADAGCDGHLSKPLDTAILKSVIQNL